jgi:hypothetical protein
MVSIVGYMGAIPNFSEEAEAGDLFQLFKDTQKKGSLESFQYPVKMRAGPSILSLSTLLRCSPPSSHLGGDQGRAVPRPWRHQDGR